MAKTVAERSAEWRRRLLLKSSIFDDLNAERAARIRQAFPGDDRPEVRAVVEFFANYPRCHKAPSRIDMNAYNWTVVVDAEDPFSVVAAKLALSEITSVPVIIGDAYGRDVPAIPQDAIDTVLDEVAQMRALGLWGQS